MSAILAKSVSIGSATISFIPRLRARLIREPVTGCPCSGLHPEAKSRSVTSMSPKLFVPAPAPKTFIMPFTVAEWQTRAQLSTLFVPTTARISFEPR